MNDGRRKAIQAALSKIAEGRSDLESALSDEQDYYDAMPESFQSGEKGEKTQGSIDALQTAIDSLEEVDSTVSDALSS